MDKQNFMSYGDAETIFSEYANAIKALDPEGGTLDTRLSAVEGVIPSGASASNQLVVQNATARLLNATYQGAGMSQRVVKLTLPSSVCGKFHVVCETGGQTSLRDFIIQTTTRTPFVNVYNLGLRTDYIVKKSNGNEVYINVPTSDGSVLIFQEDTTSDGYGNIYTVTVTTTTVNDEAFINAETVTPVNLHTTSSVTHGSTAPITSDGVAGNCPYKVFSDYSNEGNVLTYTLANGGHYECKVYYYGGLCGIYDMVRNQFGNNGGRIATVWDDSVFKNYTISIEQSTGVVSMSGTAADNVQFVITALP